MAPRHGLPYWSPGIASSQNMAPHILPRSLERSPGPNESGVCLVQFHPTSAVFQSRFPELLGFTLQGNFFSYRGKCNLVKTSEQRVCIHPACFF